MISFVWSDIVPLYAGRGGTETYTIGHVRELNARGIPARIISIGLGTEDGREYYTDIEFLSLKSPTGLSELEDTLVYINFPFDIPTKHRSFVIFHFPPLDRRNRIIDYKASLHSDTVRITNSRFHRMVWSDYLDVNPNTINIVYPFADPAFAAVARPLKTNNITRVLYAGRLHPEKGIFLLLEALHHNVLSKGYHFTATTAGDQTDPGTVIEKVLHHHPLIRVVKARSGPRETARLLAKHDVLVMPSNNQYWHEAFGMLSVEGQHAGCRVVASNADGLPETNCGELVLFEPGNSYDLALKIAKAAQTGPMLPEQRADTITHFTRANSVDALLGVINRYSAAIFR